MVPFSAQHVPPPHMLGRMKKLPDINEDMFELDLAWTPKVQPIIPKSCMIPHEPVQGAGSVTRECSDVHLPELSQEEHTAYHAERRNQAGDGENGLSGDD